MVGPLKIRTTDAQRGGEFLLRPGLARIKLPVLQHLIQHRQIRFQARVGDAGRKQPRTRRAR
jgi:hypothetical protein